MSKLKQKIASWFNITVADLDAEYPDQKLEKFGTLKGVAFSQKSTKANAGCFCSVTQWANGEGFYFDWETEEHKTMGLWKNKNIALHLNELDLMLTCLNDMKYFEND